MQPDGNGVADMLGTQPQRRKRSKRIKVEVPREPTAEDSSNTGAAGQPGIQENGHSYRNGSLKVVLFQNSHYQWQQGFSAGAGMPFGVKGASFVP